MATLLDQSSKPYESPSWTETPGRLSTTEVMFVMFDCCRIIGWETMFLAKVRGSSATTVTVSRSLATCRTIRTFSFAPVATETEVSIASKPGRNAVTT